VNIVLWDQIKVLARDLADQYDLRMAYFWGIVETFECEWRSEAAVQVVQTTIAAVLTWQVL
jgi:hypothetical protein